MRAGQRPGGVLDADLRGRRRAQLALQAPARALQRPRMPGPPPAVVVALRVVVSAPSRTCPSAPASAIPCSSSNSRQSVAWLARDGPRRPGRAAARELEVQAGVGVAVEVPEHDARGRDAEGAQAFEDHVAVGPHLGVDADRSARRRGRRGRRLEDALLVGAEAVVLPGDLDHPGGRRAGELGHERSASRRRRARARNGSAGGAPWPRRGRRRSRATAPPARRDRRRARAGPLHGAWPPASANPRSSASAASRSASSSPGSAADAKKRWSWASHTPRSSGEISPRTVRIMARHCTYQ